MNYRLYGPYERKDGRLHVLKYFEDGTRRTQSYPRHLMEQHLGRELAADEHVDHINNDKTDNRIENLQILSPAENNRKSAKAPEKQECICPECGIKFMAFSRYVRHNQHKQLKAGPFCSKRCAGKRNQKLRV